jgi:23S rRNA-/tRNA-specific pseudouridylate synthase
VLPQNIPLTILYEDEDILCIDKAAGMVVQYSSGSVENAVVHYLNHTGSTTSGGSFYASPSWPWKSDCSFEGMVHRLDKDTSGILLVAKHPQASRALRLAFAERQVHKTYLAIADGLPSDRKRLDDKKQTTQRISTNTNKAEEEPAPHQKRLSKEIKNCGRNYERASELYHQAKDPSASCLSAAISVCRRAGQRDLALSLLASSVRLTGNSATQPNLLAFKTCASLCAQDPPLCDKAIDLVIRDLPACGHALHPHCVSSAISICGRVNRLGDALDLLKRIETQEEGIVESCRMAAAKACERCGAHDMARELLREDAALLLSKHDSSERSPTLGKPIQVDAPIGKVGPRLMGVVATGREARSIVTPLAYNTDTGESFNRVVIETGRTHQIRVHMANVLGCPLLGDHVYGQKSSLRTMLHATELVVPHPTTGTTLRIVCPPPLDFDVRARHIILSENSTANDSDTQHLLRYLW